MKYFIKRANPDTKQSETLATPKDYEEAKAEYRRLQGIYPAVQLGLIVENDLDERSYIHSGYWE